MLYAVTLVYGVIIAGPYRNRAESIVSLQKINTYVYVRHILRSRVPFLYRSILLLTYTQTKQLKYTIEVTYTDLGIVYNLSRVFSLVFFPG